MAAALRWMRDRTLPAVIPVVTYGYLAEGRPSDNAKIRTSVRSTVDFAFFRPLRTLASTDQNKMLTSFRRTTKLKKRKKKNAQSMRSSQQNHIYMEHRG